MKIALLGTRGIPNHHGGFEQFAEYFSVYLAQKDFDVFVYNSHDHPYQEKKYNGVHVIHKYDPESKIGTAGQFIYDLNCILDARKRNFDLILQLGYTSSSVWGWLLPSQAFILTNMDGLEWKRSKYSKQVRNFLKYAESWAVKTSDHLIADSKGIRKYLKNTYSQDSTYIPYGANLFDNPNPSVLETYNLEAYKYNMLIARLEPENNIETILEAAHRDPDKNLFLVVGKHDTRYGGYLKERYTSSDHIKFLGGIYDLDHLNNLRHYSNLYFHGHSVGGTNPSLLEAMASDALIIAHKNIFNESILGDCAYYFTSPEEILPILKSDKKDFRAWIRSNRDKIREYYSWPIINEQYENTILNCLKTLN